MKLDQSLQKIRRYGRNRHDKRWRRHTSTKIIKTNNSYETDTLGERKHKDSQKKVPWYNLRNRTNLFNVNKCY